MLQRPDRRDGYLILKGVFSVFLGYAYAVAHVPHATRNSLSTLINVVPLRVMGILWLAAGLYCITAGFTARKIGGFGVAVFMPFTWGLVYLVCWINGDPGRGWVSTGIFWTIAGAVFCASGLIDPIPVVKQQQQNDPAE